MKKALKIIFLCLVVVALALAAGTAALLFFVDPNSFKPDLEQAALDYTGRRLKLDGDISLSLFPAVSLEAGPASLEDDEASFGPGPLLRVEKLRASVALRPLLGKRLAIDSISVSGMDLKLAVDKAGRGNWQITPRAREEAAESAPAGDTGMQAGGQLKIVMLRELALRGVNVSYADLRSGAAYNLQMARCDVTNVAAGREARLSADLSYTPPGNKAQRVTLEGVAGLPVALAGDMPYTLTISAAGMTVESRGTITPRAADGVFGLQGSLQAGNVNVDTLVSAFESRVRPAAGADGRHQPEVTGKGAAGGPAAGALARARLDVDISAQSVTSGTLTASAVRGPFRVDKGIVSLGPLTAGFGGGALRVEGTADASHSIVQSRMSGTWKAGRIGDVVKSVTGKEAFTGIVDAGWDLNAEGASWSAASRTLRGKASVMLKNGAVPAFRIIPEASGPLPARTVQLLNVESASTWTVAGGVARNDDLTLKARSLNGSLNARGSGSVTIPARTMQYALIVDKPAIRELDTIKGLARVEDLRLVISGPLGAPSIRLDEERLLRQTAAGLLDPTTKTGRKAQTFRDKLGDNLGKNLDRLFKGK